jgi:hypothetical protein
MMPREDFDSPWKEMLDLYFESFLRFFFPRIAREIDWRKGYTSLDKELRKLVREAEVGHRYVDSLVKVWKKNGAEIWVLVHVEIQTQPQPNLAERTYIYHYRIRDRYKRPVVSVAILADDTPSWRPQHFAEELWGCRTTFRFPSIKLLDYQRKIARLGKTNNPFGVIVLAHLKTLETRNDLKQRQYWKITLTKALYRRGFSKQDVLNLYRFIDWIMALPESLDDQVFQEINTYEEESKMRYITTAERIGMKKGMEKGIEKGIEKGRQVGIQEGIQHGEVIGGILLAQRLLHLTIYDRAELEKKPLAELQQILAGLEEKLPLPPEK